MRDISPSGLRRERRAEGLVLLRIGQIFQAVCLSRGIVVPFFILRNCSSVIVKMRETEAIDL